MKAGQGHPSCPAWEGEDAADYIRRLAIKCGYLAPDAPDPGKRTIPGRPQKERQPGEDDL